MRATVVSLQVFPVWQNFPVSPLLKRNLISFLQAAAVLVEDLVFCLDGIHTMSNQSLLRGHHQSVSSNICSNMMDISKGQRFGSTSMIYVEIPYLSCHYRWRVWRFCILRLEDCRCRLYFFSFSAVLQWHLQERTWSQKLSIFFPQKHIARSPVHSSNRSLLLSIVVKSSFFFCLFSGGSLLISTSDYESLGSDSLPVGEITL